MSLGLFQTPAPQLVMLANVAAGTVEAASVSAAMSEGGGACSEGGGEMMELKTVGGDFSDDEDDNIIRYSYDDQSQREVCIVEYPESPAFSPVVTGQEEEMDAQEAEAQDPPVPAKRKTPPPEPAPSPEKKSKKKPFHCKPCNFQAKSESEFVEHLQSHAVSKMLVVNKVEARSHKGKEAEPARDDPEAANQSAAGGDIKGLIRCERCGYNTNRYDHYISHLKHHSKDQEHRVFKCTLCPYTTVSQYHWRKHLRNHFPSKLHTCSQCSYFSDRKSNYVQHIRTHTGVRPFQCPYCDYSSSQKTHLTRHMRTHSGERPFKCESCDYLAANQHEVTRHARQVHNGPKPLVCPYCEYKTADRSNFKKHVELHLNPRQFNCPLCKYAASKKCNLQYHIKSRHAGCEVNLDVSKVKLRVKKSDLESREDRNGEEDSLTDAGEDLDDDFPEEQHTSPINLSIKNKKPQEEVKKPTDIGKEMDKKLKQKKMEDFVKAVERVMPKKRNKKGEDAEVEPKMDDNKKDKKEKKVKKIPSEKATKNGKTSKRKLAEALDLSHKEEPEVKIKKKKTMEDKPKKKKKTTVTGKKETGSQSVLKFPVVEGSGDGKSEQAEKVIENSQNEAMKPTNVDKRRPRLDQEMDEDLGENMKEKQGTMAAVKPKDVEKEAETSKSSENEGSAARDNGENGQHEDGDAMDEEEEEDLCSFENVQSEVGRVDQKSPKKTKEASMKVDKKKSALVEDVACDVPQSRESETDQNKSDTEQVQDPTESLSKITEDVVQNVQSASPEKAESASQTPPPSEEVFLKPSGRPPLFLQRQASAGAKVASAECEEDEGIHEAGSDVSDSASECSDDSGLKMLTPTEDMPTTPTELKAHLCVFCDRTFPFKSDYQRHLNRHLVNVYYMDSSKATK